MSNPKPEQEQQDDELERLIRKLLMTYHLVGECNALDADREALRTYVSEMREAERDKAYHGVRIKQTVIDALGRDKDELEAEIERLREEPHSAPEAELEGLLDAYGDEVLKYLGKHNETRQALRDYVQGLREQLEAMREVFCPEEWLRRDEVRELLSGLYEGVDLEEGVRVQYVGCYILKWGKVYEPTIGFNLVDADRLLEEQEKP